MRKTILAALLMSVSSCVVAQNASRLISSRDSIFKASNGLIVDTARYYYTGLRTDFDSCIIKTTSTYNNDTIIQRILYTFDGNNNITESKNEMRSGAVWQGVAKDNMTYDAANRMITKIHQNYVSNAWANAVKDSFVYDGNGDMVTSIEKNWDGNTFLNQYLQGFFYDANHNIIARSESLYNAASQTWDAYGNESFSYNANNAQLTRTYLSYYAGNWHLDNADTNVYNGTNLVLHARYYTAPVAGYTLQERDSNVYDSNNDNILSLSYIPNNGTPAYGKDTNTFDNDHNAITQVSMLRSSLLGPWQNANRYIKTFNTHHQPLTILYTTWDDVSQSWVPKLDQPAWSRFHYEEEETAVPAVTKNNFSVKLYPNPAFTLITFDMQWNMPEKTQGAIYSITGALMMQWTEDATTNVHRMIPVNSFPAGNYVLQVKGNTGKQSQLFTIVR